MKVCITGAQGFIGGRLAERYRATGAEVVGVDVATADTSWVVPGDVAEPGEWQGFWYNQRRPDSEHPAAFGGSDPGMEAATSSTERPADTNHQ